MAKAKTVPMSQQVAWLVINRDRLNEERNNGKAIQRQLAEHFKGIGEVMHVTSLYTRLQELGIEYRSESARTEPGSSEFVTVAAHRSAGTRINHDAMDLVSALNRIGNALEAISVDSHNEHIGQVLAETAEYLHEVAAKMHARIPERAISSRERKEQQAANASQEAYYLFSRPAAEVTREHNGD